MKMQVILSKDDVKEAILHWLIEEKQLIDGEHESTVRVDITNPSEIVVKWDTDTQKVDVMGQIHK